MDAIQNILTNIDGMFQKVKSAVSQDIALILCALLALIVLILLIALIDKSIYVRRLRAQLEEEREQYEDENTPLQSAEEEPAPAPTPAVQAAAPQGAADEMDLAKRRAALLSETAERSYKLIAETLEAEAERTMAFFKENRERSFEILTQAKEQAERIVMTAQNVQIVPPTKAIPAPTKAEEPSGDPYNLGSLDDLDEV